MILFYSIIFDLLNIPKMRKNNLRKVKLINQQANLQKTNIYRDNLF
jgi:hypothetical protein